MFCGNCGRAADGSPYCVACGSAMQPSNQVTPPAPQPQGPQINYPPQQTYTAPPQTNGKAIASLVLSLLGISILGVIFGHIASSEIKNSAGRQAGSGLATAGIVLGWIGMVGWVFYWIAFAMLWNSDFYI